MFAWLNCVNNILINLNIAPKEWMIPNKLGGLGKKLYLCTSKRLNMPTLLGWNSVYALL